MCGIAGFIYNPEQRSPDWATKPVLDAMLERIAHRGPDGQGVEIAQGFGLGHVRLSILDTSDAAHQPMWCAKKRYCLSYNGEIYNFKDIRAQLESRGYKFRSTGDTEVLLYALIEWGTAAFEKLEGMFAGVFYDTKTHQAIVFRDHLGIKPLYYSWHGDAFVFASEVKALSPALKSFSLNRAAVYEHVRYRYVSGTRTLFDNIHRLEAGSYMVLSAGQLTEHIQYYHIAKRIGKQGTEHKTDEAIESALRRSIRDHTVSDVGYSIQLSGGIDSSYITTVLAGNKEHIDTYSVSLPGAEDDESEYQKIVSQKCATRHHDFPCSAQDFAEALPGTTYHLDFPVVHTGTVFLYTLCKEIQKNHKVVLTGEGADELFLGYSRYNISRLHKIAFQLKRLGVKAKHIPALPKLRALKNLLERDLGLEAGVFDSPVTEDLFEGKGDIAYRQATAGQFDTLIQQLMAGDQTAYLGSLLERQDKISMAASVESRVPFCHYPLFDMVNALPAEEKNQPVPKAILKRLLAKDYDDSFVYRRKVGFRLPIREWIADPKLMGRYLDLLRSNKAQERNLYNRKILERMIDDHCAGKHDYAKELFALINIEIWAQEFGL